MPIPFTCPHCGKEMSVPEQYAGQTGPCQACGKSITIPAVGGATPSGGGSATFAGAAPPKASGGGAGVIIAIVGSLLFFGVLAVGCVILLVLPSLASVREASARTRSINNLKQIGLALHNYHSVFNELPPAVVRDKDGNALYSGRVLLLPFLEQQTLYEQWNKEEAWNGPNNSRLSRMELPVFRDPSAKTPGSAETEYLFITGPASAFEELAGEKMDFDKFTDGLSNTIVVIEVQGTGVNWAEPKDIDIKNVWPQTGNHPRVVLVLFADGSVRTILADTDPQTIKDMATRNGNEPLGATDF